MTERTPIEQAAIWLSLNNPRKAAEIMLQIIMEQEGRLADQKARIERLEVCLLSVGLVTEPQERNFTDGLEDSTGLRTSEMWYGNLYPNKEVIIIDPDGWDRSNYEYSWHRELISLNEFNKRLAISTVRISPDYCTHCKGPCKRTGCIYCGADHKDCKCQ